MLPTTSQDDVLYSIGQYATHVALCVEQLGVADTGWGAGWVNLSDYPSIGDLVVSIQRSENIDDPCASLTAVVAREFGDYSLSPLALRSPLNLVDGDFVELLLAGRGIRLYVANSPVDSPPADAAWFMKFDGVIDRIDLASGDSINIEARDLGGQLQDRQIESVNIYGSVAGQSIESVIQDILDDWSSPAVTLKYDSPGWDLKEWQQDKSSIMDAIRALSDQVGWELRYKWSVADSAYELTLYNIDRTKSVADATISPLVIKSWASAAVDGSNVRNVITVVYKVDPDTGERSSVTRDNADSIAAYGRKASEIVEAATSQIDDITEATNFANAVLADLKEPLLLGSIEIECFPHAELGDLYSFPATVLPSPRIFDSAQTLAVVGIQDNFTSEGNSTTLDLRGKPSGGYQKWLNLEARRGIGANKKLISVDGATSLGYAATLGGISVTYDEPTSVEWAYSECHISTISDFIPDETTLVGRAKATKFIIGGLIPGTTYYVKIIVIDNAGNRSTASSQAITATALIGPAHANQETGKLNLIANGEFTVTSPPGVAGEVEPDCWHAGHAVGYDLAGPATYDGWGEVFSLETTDQQSGNVSIKANNVSQTGWSYLLSEFYVCQADCYYALNALTKYYIENGPTPSFHGVLLSARILWYDSNKVYISAATPAAAEGNETYTWFNKQVLYTAPSTARYFRIYIARTQATAGYEDYSAYIDSITAHQYFVDNIAVAGESHSKQVLVSKTGNIQTTTRLCVVSADDPSNAADDYFAIDDSGNMNMPNGASSGGTLRTTGINGLLQIQRDNCNNMMQFVPSDLGTNGKEWWVTSGQVIPGDPSCIGTLGDLNDWCQTDGWIARALTPAGAMYLRSLVGTGTRVVETGADGWLTTGAAGKYEETSHKDTASGYVGRAADNSITLPASTAASQLRVGAFELQGHSANNVWFGDNMYFDGAKFVRRYSGFACAWYSLAGEMQLRMAPTGAAESEILTGGVTAIKVDALAKVYLPQQASLAYVATNSDGKIIAAATPLTNPMTTLGDGMYGGASGAVTRLAGPTVNGTYVLSEVCADGAAVDPAWLGVGVASGLATLDANSKVVQNPASASTTGGANSMPLLGANGQINLTNTFNTSGQRPFAFLTPSLPSAGYVYNVLAGTADGSNTALNVGWYHHDTAGSRYAFIGAGGEASTVGITYKVGGAVGIGCLPAAAGLTIDALTASQLVATGVSKEFVSIQYSTAGGANTIPRADGTGNINVTSSGTSDMAIGSATGLIANNSDITSNSKTALMFRGFDDGSNARHGGGILWEKDGAWVAGSGLYPSKVSIWTRSGATNSDNKWFEINNLGLATFYGDVVIGKTKIYNSVSVQKIGWGGSGDRDAYLDLLSDDTYTNYGLRLIKAAGANGGAGINFRGTGRFTLTADDAGSISFATASTDRLIITAAGLLYCPGLTASQLVATNAGQYLTNVAYSAAGAASSIVQLDAASNLTADSATLDVGWYGGSDVLLNDSITGDTSASVSLKTATTGQALTIDRASGANGVNQIMSGGTGYFILGTLGAGILYIRTDNTDRLTISATGVETFAANTAGYMACFKNDGNAYTHAGISIWAGKDAPSTNGDCAWLNFCDGDGTDLAILGYLDTSPGAAIFATSDERLKENIIDSSANMLDPICNLRWRDYDHRHGVDPKTGKEYKLSKRPSQKNSLVANEIPAALGHILGADEDGYLTLAPAGLIYPMAMAIKQLRERGDIAIIEAKARADADEAIIADLVKRIEALEKKLVK